MVLPQRVQIGLSLHHRIPADQPVGWRPLGQHVQARVAATRRAASTAHRPVRGLAACRLALRHGCFPGPRPRIRCAIMSTKPQRSLPAHRKAKPDAQPANRVGTGLLAQTLVGSQRIQLPALHLAVQVIAGRIAAPMKIEAQHMHAHARQPVGQHTQQPVRPHRLLSERIQNQHPAATLGPRGRVIQRSQPPAAACRNVDGHHDGQPPENTENHGTPPALLRPRRPHTTVCRPRSLHRPRSPRPRAQHRPDSKHNTATSWRGRNKKRRTMQGTRPSRFSALSRCPTATAVAVVWSHHHAAITDARRPCRPF